MSAIDNPNDHELPKLLSPCCHARIRVAKERDPLDPQWSQSWYECTHCGEECDPVLP